MNSTKTRRTFVERRRLQRRIAAVSLLAAFALLLLLTPTGAGKDGYTSIAVTPPAAPGTPGTTAGGNPCAPGVRQLPGSAYSPLCIPAWHGINGGSTSIGVTPTTITVTYRQASSTQIEDLYSLLPKSVVGTNENIIQTLQTYVNEFNKSFDLYGRKVVLKPYQGQGDFISEETGSGQAGAQADAEKARSEYGAFADVSMFDASPPYTQALASQHVISFPINLGAEQTYQQNAPYEYTPGPDCSKGAAATSAILGQALNNQPAMYAGSADLRSKQRVYGIITTANTLFIQCANILDHELIADGARVAVNQSVTFNPTDYAGELSTDMAKMKQAGVTTVICSSCDPITPGFAMGQATNQGYFPEWFLEPAFAADITLLPPFLRLFPGNQSSSVLTFGITPGPRSEQEAVKVYEAGNNGSTDGLMPTYNFAYSTLMMLFDGLQAAGPDLNPATFAQGLANSSVLPASGPTASFGAWNFGPGTFDPASNFQILQWNNNQTSVFDGKPGSLTACNGGTNYYYSELDLEFTPSTAVTCPSG